VSRFPPPFFPLERALSPPLFYNFSAPPRSAASLFRVSRLKFSLLILAETLFYLLNIDSLCLSVFSSQFFFKAVPTCYGSRPQVKEKGVLSSDLPVAFPPSLRLFQAFSFFLCCLLDSTPPLCCREEIFPHVEICVHAQVALVGKLSCTIPLPSRLFFLLSPK